LSFQVIVCCLKTKYHSLICIAEVIALIYAKGAENTSGVTGHSVAGVEYSIKTGKLFLFLLLYIAFPAIPECR